MSDEYSEYRRNLYTDAMGCVRNATGSNVYPVDTYPHGIPLAVARQRLAQDNAEAYENVFRIPGDVDGINPDGSEHIAPDTYQSTGHHSWARVSDHHEFARFGSESAATRRNYPWLLDVYASGLVGGNDGLHITSVGTTRNGGRAFVQLSTAQILSVQGLDFANFLTVFMAHDGSLSVGSSLGTSILACTNMLGGLIATANVKSKQTSRVTDAGILARHAAILGLEWQSEKITTALTGMAETTFSAANWSAFLDAIAPVNVKDASKNAETRNEHTRETLTELYKSDPRVTVAPENTVLRAFQAVNTFDLWERGTRGDTDEATRMTDEFLSGRLATRETSRVEQLQRVLAAV